MNRPSSIPPDGRELASQELSNLVGEMTEIVQTSHLFKSLDDEGRERVLRSGYAKTFAAGEEIVREGDEGSTLYLVLSGSVHVTTEAPSGTIHLAELGRGACLGEVSVLTGNPRTATVKALTDVDVAAFERHRIERVLSDYPRVRQLLESLVESRARDTIEKIVSGGS